MTRTVRTFLDTGALGTLLLVAAVAGVGVGQLQGVAHHTVIAGGRLAGGNEALASATPMIDWP
ncbi:hypothetical protein ABZW47_17715 [Streptomyces sp. NPDC004549]|uniref:hypothetical protein n=1 Tax=Streptomyces sp. NPDC004549 TaxID=3154283 RepID=UPI00339EF862